MVYCAQLPPEEVTRFFIGKNITEPKAFGIYRDSTGDFVVYKNKSDGQRAIRYQGADEAYALIQDYVDPNQIKDSLLNKEKVSVENFLYVALYISAVNSFLEEIFFRGLLFLQVKKSGHRKLAYNLSALFFAVYHIGIVSGWFNIWVFLPVIFLLYVAGIILNKAAEACDSFLGSWVIHIAANLGINAIGCYLLGVF